MLLGCYFSSSSFFSFFWSTLFFLVLFVFLDRGLLCLLFIFFLERLVFILCMFSIGKPTVREGVTSKFLSGSHICIYLHAIPFLLNWLHWFLIRAIPY